MVLIELLMRKLFLVLVSLLHSSELIPIQMHITLVFRLRNRRSLPKNLELSILHWLLDLRLYWQLDLTILLGYFSFVYLAVLQ